MPLPRAPGPAAARRPRLGHADLQRLHGRAHLPSRRGLTRDRASTQRSGGESPARRPVSRVLSRDRSRGRSSISTAGRPTAHAADPRAGQRTSPPSRLAARRVAPSYLALLRVEFAAFHPGGRSRRTRLCGTGPRLTADGRYPLPCAEELGLSSSRRADRPGARPSGRLAGRPILPRRGCRSGSRRDPLRRPAGGRPTPDRRQRPVDRLVAQRVGGRFWARGTWTAVQRSKPGRRRRTSAWSGWSLASLTRQRPWTCSTMSFESSSRWTSRAPSSAASPSARTTAVYSATLFVWTPR